MRPRGHLPKPAIFSRRLLSIAVRSVAIASMSFAAAFGFLSGATSPGAHYDPHMFAIGVSALFGAACGGIGILISRIRQMKIELRDMEDAPRRGGGSQLGNQGGCRSAAKSFLEALGRRDRAPRQRRPHHLRQRCVLRARRPRARRPHRRPRLRLPCSKSRAKSRRSPTARACTTRRSPRPQARAGSPGARSRCAMPAPGERDQSVGRDVTGRVRGRAGARPGARPGGNGEPRQMALPRHGVARDPHAAERHSRHGRPPRATRR